MASYSATVPASASAEVVFGYLADFRTVSEWDPSITAAEMIGDGEPIRVGARFRVTTKTNFGDVVLDYETTELEPPRRIVLRGEHRAMISIDTITVEETQRGRVEVTYRADITLKGPLKIADPLLALGLRRLGDKARDGLARKLAGDLARTSAG